MDIPDDFRCPISLDIMTDPVIITSGHTFDRSSIQRWLDRGNLTCPLTNLPILTPLIPNHSLRRLILNSCFTPNPPNNYNFTLAQTQNYSFTTQSLSSLLTSIQTSADFRQKVAESFLPKTLLRHVSSSSNPELQKLAIYSLLYLSLESDDIKVGLVAEGAVDSLVNAIQSTGNGKSNAAAASTVITSLVTADVNKITVGSHPNAIQSLLSLLLVEGSTKREKRESLTAIYELCKFPENRKRVVRVSGSVICLIRLADSGLDRAVEVLGQLAKSKEGRAEIVREKSEFVRVMLGILENGTRRGMESGLNVLGLVCLEDEGVRKEAARFKAVRVLEKLCEGDDSKIVKLARGLLQKFR